MRSLAREAVFKYLFSRLFNPSDEGLFTVLIKDLSGESKDFASDLLDFVISGEEKYLSDIERHAIGYKLNRINNADKCALMIGMSELDNYPNTPIPVIIDQAVNIVAKYSTESSTDFVNGLLAGYAKEIRND